MNINSIGMQIRKIEKEISRRNGSTLKVRFLQEDEAEQYQPQEGELVIVSVYVP